MLTLNMNENEIIPQIKHTINCLIDINNIKLISMNDLILTKLIGEGGQSKVYEGYFENNHSAIKIFNNIDWKSFMNEIIIISNLKHPSIPKFFGIINENKIVGVVTEYIKGRTLEEIKVNDLSYNNKLHIAKNIAEVLESMHIDNFIHRDLKPGNIMIDENINTFLIDFGISKICVNKKNSLTLTKGTINYLAPECLEIIELSENEEIISMISTKVDVWSFGCLLSYLFSGIIPWDNLFAGDEHLLQKSLMEKNEFPIPDIIKNKYPEIYNIIKEATIVDENKRPNISQICDMLEMIK